MTPADLTAWRAFLGYTRVKAAKELGCHYNTITGWESGRTAIPKYIALACRALAYGMKPWGE